jgi:DNA polymerase/3'-5' exonuclease PolX
MNKIEDLTKLKIININNKYIIDEFIKYYMFIYSQYNSGKIAKDKKVIYYKLIAIKKVIDILIKFKKEIIINTVPELSKLKGFGEKTIARIKEIIQNGHLAEIKEEIIYTSELSNIYGIGPVKASYYYEKYNVKTIDDFILLIKEGKIKITKQIELGIKYRNLLSNHIPRILIMRIEIFIQNTLNNIDKDYVSVVCGSYRREKEYSSDIDILITHKQLSNKNQMRPYLQNVIDKLSINKSFIIDSLTENYVSHFQGFASINPKSIKDIPTCDFDIKKIIRVDFIIIPYESFYTALMHFTGSGDFNQMMRIHAKNLNMKLNEYGLFKKDKNNKYKRIEINSETDIFNNMLLKYVPPNKR